MDASIICLLLDKGLPVGVFENEWGVLIGIPDVFEFSDNRVRFRVRGICVKGYWIGDVNCVGKSWGYSGPTSLEYSERHASLRDLVFSNIPYLLEHLKGDGSCTAAEPVYKKKLLSYLKEWESLNT